jgi:hypothetical protein
MTPTRAPPAGHIGAQRDRTQIPDRHRREWSAPPLGPLLLLSWLAQPTQLPSAGLGTSGPERPDSRESTVPQGQEKQQGQCARKVNFEQLCLCHCRPHRADLRISSDHGDQVSAGPDLAHVARVLGRRGQCKPERESSCPSRASKLQRSKAFVSVLHCRFLQL